MTGNDREDKVPLRFMRRWWWAVCCGGVALAGIIAAFLVAPGGHPVPAGLAQPGTAHARQARTPGLAATRPAAAAHSPESGTAATPGSTPSSRPASRAAGRSVRPSPATIALPHLPARVKPSLSRWAAGPGGAAWTRVSRQFGDSAQAGGGRLYLTMRQACQGLTAAVSAARSAPPIPSSVLQAHYARALGEFAAASRHCQAGISATESRETAVPHVNRALIHQAMQELAAGGRQLYVATSRIKVPAGGHHH